MSLDNRSLGDLVARLVGDLSDLVRKESQLVRAEFSEKVATVGGAAGMLGAGAALLLGAFLCVLVAIVLALSRVVDPILAAVIVAVVAAVVGAVLVRLAIKKMQPAELAPQRSAHQLREDVRVMRGGTHMLGRS